MLDICSPPGVKEELVDFPVLVEGLKVYESRSSWDRTRPACRRQPSDETEQAGLLRSQLLQQVANFLMSSVFSPPCRRRAHLGVFDVTVSTLLQQKLDHLPVSI
jgi:hypothetical protein